MSENKKEQKFYKENGEEYSNEEMQNILEEQAKKRGINKVFVYCEICKHSLTNCTCASSKKNEFYIEFPVILPILFTGLVCWIAYLSIGLSKNKEKKKE